MDTVEDKDKIYLFVYGSLKRGKEYNYLLSGAKFISEAVTLEKYSMYVDSIPYVYKDKNISHICGELYEIDNKILKEIDLFEDHPNFYFRELVDVKTTTGMVVKSWIYFLPEEKGELLTSGSF